MKRITGRRPGRLLATLLGMLLVLGAAADEATPLPDKVDRILRKHRVPLDAVTVVVQAVDEDQPRLALNLDKARNPASVIKLVTTWTALDLLGPTFTWPTRFYALGPINDGVLDGDLLIQGNGDPYLLREDFWRMLGELRGTGLREIRGRLLIDDSLFDVTESDPGAFDSRPFRLYNTLPSALMINFQAVDFSIEPDAASGKVDIRTVPRLDNLEIHNEIKLVKGPCRGSSPKIFMRRSNPANADHIAFGGTMPFACKRYPLSRSVMTPASYAYGVFKSTWSQWGGQLDGGFAIADAPTGKRPLLVGRSRTLAEVIRPLNKWSNNLMTRMLLYTIGETRFDPPITREEGSQALREHLDSRGLDTTQLAVDNGSGLSRDTRVTGRLMRDLLMLAWRQPTMPEFLASMSIAGRDGTMRKRFKRGKERGRMHLKTGSLDNVSAVAGYVHTTDGRTFAVAMLMNHRRVNWGVGRDLQDALLAWTFRQQ